MKRAPPLNGAPRFGWNGLRFIAFPPTEFAGWSMTARSATLKSDAARTRQPVARRSASAAFPHPRAAAAQRRAQAPRIDTTSADGGVSIADVLPQLKQRSF